MDEHHANSSSAQSEQSDNSTQSDQADRIAMVKEAVRQRALRKGKPPPKKKTSNEQPPEGQPKPLNHNDLAKWIVISDAPDYASVKSKFGNTKNFPVLPRNSKYLEQFGARELRIGLKSLRAMTDAAQEQNQKLEQEAQNLGCVTDEASSTVDEEVEKSNITVLCFDLNFYRTKVLPFIQACLIAEGQLDSLPPRAPVALPFPGGVYDTFDSPLHRSVAKTAYDVARAGGLPQEACDTAAQKRLSFLKKTSPSTLASTSTTTSPEPNDDNNNGESQTQANNSATDSERTQTLFYEQDERPLTPAPYRDDVFMGSYVGSQTQSATTTTNNDEDGADSERAQTPSWEANDQPLTPAITKQKTAEGTKDRVDTPNTNIRNADALGGLPSSSSSSGLPPPPPSLPLPPLRRSTRSTAAAAVGDAAEPPPLKGMSVWELQREILRLCPLREKTVARNEVLREFLKGAKGEMG